MVRLLNLGCGPRFSSDSRWTNVDFISTDDRVIQHNLSEGIPFPAANFDAVYHSHVLEHFTQQDGARFLGECFRVVKPHGVLRVAVPDLEQICRLYLRALDELQTGNRSWKRKYEWMMLEMYDQSVRTVPGGRMAEYLRNSSQLDKEFIISRAGSIARELIETSDTNPPEQNSSQAVAWKRRVRRLGSTPKVIRRLVSKVLLSGHEKDALALGLFRLGGEIHQWMYDKYSLQLSLEQAGFIKVHKCVAQESGIEGWKNYYLDIDEDGFEHAPSSLYMEGVRPA